MGIRGLTSYVRETLTWEREEEVLPRGSILLVDGNGWGWSLIENKVSAFGLNLARTAVAVFYWSLRCSAARHGPTRWRRRGESTRAILQRWIGRSGSRLQSGTRLGSIPR